MRTALKIVGVLALTVAAATVSARDAVAASREECLQSHESSQLLRRKRQLRAAREQLLICSQEVCPRIVRLACAEWLEEVEASTPTIVVEARGPRGEPMAEVSVAMDGVPMFDCLDGRASTVDPGEHRFRFESADKRARELVVVVPEGRRNWPVVAEFEPREPAVVRDVAAEQQRVAAEQARRTKGYVIGGIGGASLVAGAVFGLLAISADNKAVCPSPCRERDDTGAPNAKLVRAHEASDRAGAFAWVSDIAIGAGILGVGAGAYFALTARRTSAAVVPAPLARGGAVLVEGSF